MKIIENQTLDMERALYASTDLKAVSCRFDGPADGESAFKESKRVEAESCYFNLRYPFWHTEDIKLRDCHLTENCRAALWYCKGISAEICRLHGIKALRECTDTKICCSDIISPEFGWKSERVSFTDVTAESEYFMLMARSVTAKNLRLKGKYSFQYVVSAELSDCCLDTKDAFWHAENITIKNSVIKGEYLAWYSKNVTLENCKIYGTQPFCYCENLRLIGCEMHDTDLAFEKSEVEADITTEVISIKNPLRGRITVPSAGEIIIDDPDSKAQIIVG